MVSVFLGDNSSNTPDARVQVNFMISHEEVVYRNAEDSTQTMLRRFGADQKMLDCAFYEVEVEAYIALDARYIRKHDQQPVIEAFTSITCDEKDKARLIRQRRLVPESYEAISKIYGPQDKKGGAL